MLSADSAPPKRDLLTHTQDKRYTCVSPAQKRAGSAQLAPSRVIRTTIKLNCTLPHITCSGVVLRNRRFPKRNFRCDCPTAAITHACTLHTQNEPPNAANQYGQNFQAKFCRCGRPYDAKTERETMIQCLSCEVCVILSLLQRFLNAYLYVGLVP